MRNKFDKQLDRLNVELIDMGQLCEVAIGKATKALEKDSEEIAKEVISADAEIDQKEKEIDQLCLKLILQQQPVAKDLRQISAALKMITDMERIGDQASDIAEIILSAEIKDTRAIPEIVKMASAASAMVRSSVMAYVNKDLDLAKKVLEADDKVDNMFDNIKHKLIEFIAKEGGNQGEDVIDFLMIAKYLERIGDHATNIAEWVEFSITGIHRSEEVI